MLCQYITFLFSDNDFLDFHSKRSHLQLLGIEISRSSYSQIECGTYNIRISELVALADLFRVDYNAFFENLTLPI